MSIYSILVDYTCQDGMGTLTARSYQHKGTIDVLVTPMHMLCRISKQSTLADIIVNSSLTPGLKLVLDQRSRHYRLLFLAIHIICCTRQSKEYLIMDLEVMMPSQYSSVLIKCPAECQFCVHSMEMMHDTAIQNTQHDAARPNMIWLTEGTVE